MTNDHTYCTIYAIKDDLRDLEKGVFIKVHKHEIIWNFFLPKSNPYMPFVYFRKKFRFFSLDFRQNFDVRTFPRGLSIPNFFDELSKKFFFQNLQVGPIRWFPRTVFENFDYLKSKFAF
jgi:hypothetical protein